MQLFLQKMQIGACIFSESVVISALSIDDVQGQAHTTLTQTAFGGGYGYPRSQRHNSSFQPCPTWFLGYAAWLAGPFRLKRPAIRQKDVQMYPLLTRCPVCEGTLAATKLECAQCHTTVENRFDLGGLLRLRRDQLQFVELLVKNRGNINSVATELGVSYTTARSRMDDIVTALGYNTAPVAPPAERLDILARLERGELTPEAALEQLKGK